MKRIIWILSIFPLLLIANTPNIQALSSPFSLSKPQNIQVLLESDVTEALLEVRGPYYVYDPNDGSQITSGLLGKRYIVHARPNGIKWGEEFAGVHQIYVIPKSEETPILLNGIQYNGAIIVYQVNNRIHVVNDLEIEKFIKSTLSSSFLYPLEEEAMNAVAILARTDAYYNMYRNIDRYWHVKKEEIDYLGAAMVAPGSFVEEAVDATKNLILSLTDHGKKVPFKTEWTKNSAGKTASYSSIFRLEALAPMQGVSAPHAAFDRDDSRWVFQLSNAQLAKIFDLDQVTGIELFLDKSSKKTYAVRLKEKDINHDFDFFKFQEKIGQNRLLSNDFTVFPKDQGILFTGFGEGHGVGLCLYSASLLSQNGENAVQILNRFYPESSLLNLNSAPLILEKK